MRTNMKMHFGDRSPDFMVIPAVVQVTVCLFEPVFRPFMDSVLVAQPVSSYMESRQADRLYTPVARQGGLNIAVFVS